MACTRPMNMYRFLPFACSAFGCLAQQFLRDDVPDISSGVVLATLDLDGDDATDLVTIDHTGATLSTWHRIAPARYRLDRQTLTAPHTAPADGHLPAGDVDGDGDDDLVLLRIPLQIVVLSNHQGRLDVVGTALPATGSGPPDTMRLLDIDGDRDLDLMWTAVAGTGVLTNSGPGGFVVATPSPLPTTRRPARVVAGDVDRDGRADVIGLDQVGLLAWCGRGGALADESATRLPTLSWLPTSIGLDDIDHDGDLDLYGARPTAPFAFLLTNDGTGTFSDASNRLLTLGPSSAHPVALDDDGDGDLDLLFGLSLLRNDGLVFRATRQLDWFARRAIDLDGDRFGDHAAFGGLVRNDAGMDHLSMLSCGAQAAADIDRDGDHDPIASSALWRTEGGSRAFFYLPMGSEPGAFADLDADGDADFVDILLRCWENDVTGTFVHRSTVPGSAPVGATLSLFDADGDGDPDILLTGQPQAPALPIFWRNEGNWTFTNRTATTFPGPAAVLGHIAIGDLDDDGDLDLVSTSRTGTLTMLNDGRGSLLDAGVLPVFGSTLTLAQIDRDPPLELLVADATTSHLFDRVGLGWADASGRLPPLSLGVERFVVADCDDDGAQDILVAAPAGSLLMNDGAGTFRDVTRTHGPIPGTARSLADVDGDGDPDLLDGEALWLNQHRQLETANTPRVGGTLELTFVGERNYGTGVIVCIPTLALRRSPAGVPAFGGRFLPDAPSSLPLPAIVSVRGQPGEIALPVPNTPWVAGLVLQLQGLVIDNTGTLRLPTMPSPASTEGLSNPDTRAIPYSQTLVSCLADRPTGIQVKCHYTSGMEPAHEPDWTALADLALGQEGVFTTAQAAEVGYSPQLLAHHVRAGRFARVRRGIYRLTHFPGGAHEHLIVEWLWSEQRGVFSHETALSLHRLSDVMPAQITLTVPIDSSRKRHLPADVELHRAEVPDAEREWSGPVPITRVARTLNDCARAGLSPDLLEQAARQALRRGLVQRSEIPDVLAVLLPYGGLAA